MANHTFFCIDAHTCGNPVRVVAGGGPPLKGASMSERRQHFLREYDWIRTGLMFEPRGHDMMSGSILYPPTREDCDIGILFIETSGCLPMCGHGTIGVATVLVETGAVEVKEPVTEIRLDTPAGLVAATVEVDGGRARAVTIRNVPAYLQLRDAVVTVPGFGPLTLDLAWGGNFYAILPAASVGLAVEPPAHDALVAAGLTVMSAVNEQLSFAHPEHTDITECHHVIFTAPSDEPGVGPSAGRGATVIHPGWIDRSPCGTGTSARMAQRHARGELSLHQEFTHYSLIGSRFTGQLVETTRVGGFAAVVPTIRGRAWVTGLASYLLDPDDPFPAGFLISALGPASGWASGGG